MTPEEQKAIVEALRRSGHLREVIPARFELPTTYQYVPTYTAYGTEAPDLREKAVK